MSWITELNAFKPLFRRGFEMAIDMKDFLAGAGNLSRVDV